MRTVNLDLRIGDRLLIGSLNWKIEAGQCWCVIGRNGAGKSTLLRTLAGLHSPQGGMVELAKRPLQQWPLHALARERAFLPQGRSDAFGYRAIETVLAARHPYSDAGYWESGADHHAAYAALQALEVHHLANQDIRTLSGGERQRVAIAAVLAQDAPLMLMDEPANALDLPHQVSLMRLLARLCRKDGKTIAMASHDLNMAHGVASHALLLMGNGEWHAGPVADVMTPTLLSLCLGHPIELVRHGNRMLYLPVEESDHE